MSRDLDLFEWASTQPTAIVIDAREMFLAREVAFIRQLIVGYQPPTSGGSPPVDLATYRRRPADGPKTCPSDRTKTRRTAR